MDSLVSTQWLAGALGDADLIVLDATRHLPGANRDAAAEFAAGHIPGARFFDLAKLVDKTSDVPAAFPRADQLAALLGELGVSLAHRIVIYDDSDVKTAARAWYILTAYGLSDVAILDGGLGKWRGEGRALEAGEPDIAATQPPTLSQAEGVRLKADILAMIDDSDSQLLDARGRARFEGDGEDPVHGGTNGHIPGSRNLPYPDLYEQDGTFKSPEALRALFEAEGIDLDAPVTTTCGSGVTACALIFALHRIGHTSPSLYDGSWLDWSADPEMPKASGPAR